MQNDDVTMLLWAKSSASGGHPLIQHLLDVAAVAHEWALLLPEPVLTRLAGSFQIATHDVPAWAAAICGLHDLGKATPGFQAKWAPGQQRAAAGGFDFPRGAPDRHDAATAYLLPRVLRARGLDQTSAVKLTRAVAAHHGFEVPPTAIQQVALFQAGFVWGDAANRLAVTVLDTLVAGSPVPRLGGEQGAQAAALMLLAGLCAASDWIGSSDGHFPHGRPWESAASHYAHSRRIARSVLQLLGLAEQARPGQDTVEAWLSAALPPGAAARPLQQAVADLLAGAEAAPAMLVIEAPMGEGKTEAAFIADAWSRAAHAARGAYFAMPTQATSNALFTRAAAYLARLFPEQRVELQLAHGSATLEAMRLRLRDVGFGSGDASVGATSWFVGTKRTLLAANAVGTVDQALVAILHAKHHFVRLFGLANRVVVLDEVHAYDAYTGGLIEALVRWLKACGCTVVVMSATLPAERRAALVAAFDGATAGCPDPGYPRVCLVQSGRSPAAVRLLPARHQRVQVRCVSAEPADIAALAAESAGQGAAVLVVANTVRRAQAVFQALADKPGIEPSLFHARFPMEERLAIERDVVGRFGPGDGRRARSVVVATQVAEQSLDVDFDLLISDLAPIDLLLQRIGRMHRHQRPRPACAAQPVVHVAGLSEVGDVDERAFKPVYHPLPVLRTAAALAACTELQLPDDIDRLVQHVYGDAPPSRTDPAFIARHAAAAAEWQADNEKRGLQARQAGLPAPADWPPGQPPAAMDDALAAEGLARFGTRIGEPSLSVIPIHLVDGRWHARPVAPGFDAGVPIGDALAEQLAQRYLRLSHPRLVSTLAAKPVPPGWDRHPALAGHRPLCLDSAGCAHVAGLRVRLDPLFGLVIGDLPDAPAATPVP